MATKKQFTNSTEVRRELSDIYHQLKHDEIPSAKANNLSNLLYKILMSIQTELKERELLIQYKLAEQLEKSRGGK